MAVEIACSRCSILNEIVCIESPAQLLCGVAHAVGAVSAGSGVVSEALACHWVVAADVFEVIGVALNIGAWFHFAFQFVVHAGAKFFVGRWRERSRLCAEVDLRGWAGLRLVGWIVVIDRC